jgi:hypothetical protein
MLKGISALEDPSEKEKRGGESHYAMSLALKLASVVGADGRSIFSPLEVLTCRPWTGRMALGGLELTTRATLAILGLLVLALRLIGLEGVE